MEKKYIKARAKVNLSLEILDKREDGYHNLATVFQKINLYDELYIEKTNTNNIEIITNLKNVELKNNIIYKAYLKLKEQYDNIKGIKVTLIKNIPTEAGLAGGSADCASFILALNKLYNLNMNKEQLISIGKTLGADVCACFYNQAVIGKGIGEILNPIHTNFKYYIILIKPNFSCNTKEMFNKLDGQERIINKETTGFIVKALKDNNIKMLGNNLYNVFEDVIDEKQEINRIKKELIQEGAIGAILTGSGSCVYGIFKDKENAKRAYKNLKQNYETYYAISYNTRKDVI